jgi:RNA methyltransferase, TrmH family
LPHRKWITSAANPLAKEVRRACQRGTLTRSGWAVAENFHLLAEAVRSGSRIQAMLVSEAALARFEALPFARDLPVTVVADRVFDALAATETSQGVITLFEPRQSSWEALLAPDAWLAVLDGVQDPGNAGAIARAAEAFGATGLIFVTGSVGPYHPKTLRASAGSIFRLPVLTGEPPGETARRLADAGALLLAADPRASLTLAEVRIEPPAALLIGSEGHGLRPELARRASGFRIPTRGVESLNAAVAAGIVLYEVWRRRQTG